MSNRNIVIIAVVTVIVVFLAIFIVFSGQNNTTDSSKNTEQENLENMEGAVDTPEVATEPTVNTEDRQGGEYLYYKESLIERAENNNVVLFFRASWCPTCRVLDSDIKENLSNIPQNLTIMELDYDKETELRNKYGVTYQHTLVQVDQNGNQIKKWSGGNTLQSIVNNLI